MKLVVIQLETLITDKQYKQLFEDKHTYKQALKMIKNILQGDICLHEVLVMPTKRKRRKKK